MPSAASSTVSSPAGRVALAADRLTGQPLGVAGGVDRPARVGVAGSAAASGPASGPHLGVDPQAGVHVVLVERAGVGELLHQVGRDEVAGGGTPDGAHDSGLLPTTDSHKGSGLGGPLVVALPPAAAACAPTASCAGRCPRSARPTASSSSTPSATRSTAEHLQLDRLRQRTDRGQQVLAGPQPARPADLGPAGVEQRRHRGRVGAHLVGQQRPLERDDLVLVGRLVVDQREQVGVGLRRTA